MVTDPVEAEATGQRLVPVEFAGRSWLVPLDVDDWPLDDLIACVRIHEIDDRFQPRPDKAGCARVLQQLLGDQWADFIAAAPKARDLVPASNAIAAAVGIPADPAHPLDVAFGAIPRLLLLMSRWPGPIEATLQTLNLDYRDRWRRDETGTRRLTLRQIYVNLAYASYDSPLAIARNNGRRPQSDAALAVMDLYEVIARTPHPSRPLPPKEREKRQTAQQKHDAAVADYKARHSKSAGRLSNALDIARHNARQ